MAHQGRCLRRIVLRQLGRVDGRSRFARRCGAWQRDAQTPTESGEIRRGVVRPHGMTGRENEHLVEAGFGAHVLDVLGQNGSDVVGNGHVRWTCLRRFMFEHFDFQLAALVSLQLSASLQFAQRHVHDGSRTLGVSVDQNREQISRDKHRVSSGRPFAACLGLRGHRESLLADGGTGYDLCHRLVVQVCFFFLFANKVVLALSVLLPVRADAPILAENELQSLDVR